MVAYKPDEYINSVLPAKFFECIATKKPFVVSGLSQVSEYDHIIYDVEGSENKLLNVVTNLLQTETTQVIDQRDKTSRSSTWEKRAGYILDTLESEIYEKKYTQEYECNL